MVEQLTETTPTQRNPKRWAVFTWLCDNDYPPPVESEITDLLDMIEKATPKIESGWLIETAHIDGTPHWWNGQHYDDDCWTKNSLDAIRYARREDAEKIIKHFGWTSPPVIATEHQWG